jgi:uncharacterized protein (TIGR02147 family)
MKMPNIFDFSTATDFFVEVFKAFKESGAEISTRELGAAWGFKTPADFMFTIQRKRKIKLSHIVKIGEVLKLSEKEITYWKTLLQLEKATNVNEKNLYLLFLNELKGVSNQETYKTVDQFEVISHWVHMAILSMTKLQNFSGTEKQIFDLLQGKVGMEEIKDALGRLLSLQLLTYDDQGKLTPTFNKVTTPHDVKDVGVHKYYKDVFKLGINAIKMPVDKREFQSFNLPMNKENLVLAKKIIREFRSQFVKAIETPENGDDVFQMNIQFFPLTDSGTQI